MTEPEPGDGQVSPLQVTVLDVGQGTAVIVRSGERTLVYDTGGGDPAGANMASAVVLPYLRHLGITAINTLVISHPDNDHSAGAATLIADMPTSEVFYGGDGQALAGGKPCLAGQAWRWPEGPTFQFVAPMDNAPRSSNDSSCVLMISAAGHRLLLAGDVESGQERGHGAFLEKWINGRLAAGGSSRQSHIDFPSPCSRPFGHLSPLSAAGTRTGLGIPTRILCDACRGAGTSVYGTARSGALEFIFASGLPVQVHQRRRASSPFLDVISSYPLQWVGILVPLQQKQGGECLCLNW